MFCYRRTTESTAAYVCSLGPCQKVIMLYDTVLCDVTVQLILTAHREHSCVCCLHTLPAISVKRNVFLLVIAIHLVNFMQHKGFVIIRAKQDQCYHKLPHYTISITI